MRTYLRVLGHVSLFKTQAEVLSFRATVNWFLLASYDLPLGVKVVMYILSSEIL